MANSELPVSDNRHWSRIAPLLLLAGLAFLLGCFELTNYDIWWHLRTGELIPERGVPRTDWYSFTSSERPWIDVHWGFQVLASSIHRHFGVRGLVLAKALVACLTILLCLGAYRREWPVAMQVLVWLPALLLMSSRFYVRPEILTLLFTAVFLTVLFHAEARPRWLWLLPPVQVIWSNCQGLYVFGPVLLGMYVVEVLARQLLAAPMKLKPNNELPRHLWPVTLLVGLACLVSPYGIRNVLFVFELGQKMAPDEQLYSGSIAELQDVPSFWRTGGWTSEYAWLLILLLVVSVVSILVGWRAIILRGRWFRLLALLAFGWLGLRATRNGNHFALVAGTMICWNLGAVVPQRGRRSRLAPWVCCGLILAVGWLVVSGRWYLALGGHRRIGLGERSSFYSHDAVRMAGRPGMPRRAAIFHMGHAATFIHANGPQSQVFFDGRLEVHSPQLFQIYSELDTALRDDGRWDPTLRAFGIDMVLADGEYNWAVQATLLGNSGWRCLYYDEVLALFVRREVTLPPGVAPLDFRHRLFEAQAPLAQGSWAELTDPPRWYLIPPESIYKGRDDHLAARLWSLGLGTVARAGVDRVTARAILWAAVQAARRGQRRRPWDAASWRYFGAALLTLSDVADAGDGPLKADQPWETARGLLASMGIFALRQARMRDPAEYTGGFLLQSEWARRGALELSLEPLQQLAVRRPTNRYQLQVAGGVADLLRERRQALVAKQAELTGVESSFEGLLHYAEVGLIGQGLTKVHLGPPAELSPKQIDRLATWHLLLGQPQAADELYQAGQNRPGFEPGLIDLRRGTCALVCGDEKTAQEWLHSALQQNPKLAEAHFPLAVLSLLLGDQAALDGFTHAGLQLPANPVQHQVLRELSELVPAVAEK